jgi:uncharacterized protein (DUF1778 family)
MGDKRTALLIHCSNEEAQQIREAARRERRTISGYVLHAVMSRLASQASQRKALAAAYPQLYQKPK